MTARASKKAKATPRKRASVVEETALVLRTCNADGTSHGGFQWPESGPVVATDWSPKPVCGQGLHGLIDGVGDYSLLSRKPDAKWLIVTVKRSDVIDLDGKVKFPAGEVVYSGTMPGALTRISQYWTARILREATTRLASKARECAAATGYYGHAAATGNSGHAAATGNYGHAAATGNYGHAAATGYYGHAAATGNSGHAAATGNYGHAAATGDSGHAAATGYSGHAAATGDSGHAAATGNYGHAAATGNYGHAAATGNYGHAAATGNSGHAAATGYYGHAAATGYYGHAAATGNYGHAAATGDSGHAAATGNYGAAVVLGHQGSAQAGKNGLLAVAWFDGSRPRLAVGYVGENGIKPNTSYTANAKGELVEVK